jgi:hypothetical protein
MKVVKKIQSKPYCIKRIGSLLGKRPFSSIENLSEGLVSQRHKVYLPKDFDLVEYDKYLF